MKRARKKKEGSMTTMTLYYATNRKHEGTDRWHPTGYGTKFSDDGMENLRFGRIDVQADAARVEELLMKGGGAAGPGDGEALADYLGKRAKSGRIDAFEEKLDPKMSDRLQTDAKLGSKAMFADLQGVMTNSTDVVVFVHGFNVSWADAVGSALALQTMLDRSPVGDPAQHVAVVLFTWPSDGLALPFASYKSDRTEAAGSGNAFARGLLKVRDFLIALRRGADSGGPPLCGQDIHLLCHSMGNYLLQNTLTRIDDYTPGSAMPRLFENIFLCAPDVDDAVLEPDQPLGRLHEIARSVTVYYNRGDKALVISDYTKGNPERLGSNGAARPQQLHIKFEQVDCSDIVEGGAEHSYYLSGHTNSDIRLSIDGQPPDGASRRRRPVGTTPRVWRLE